MIITFIISAIRLSAVFLFGSTGEILTEKSGNLNLGIPGVMCIGASCGCLAENIYFKSIGTGEPSYILAVLIPILAAVIGGGVIGLIYSFLTVTLRANQNVTGLTLTTLGAGVSNYMIAQLDTTFSRGGKFFTSSLIDEIYVGIYKLFNTVEKGEHIETLTEKLGTFGELVLSYGILVWLAIAVAIIASVFLTKSKKGLYLRAVGENPATADATGINVTRYKYIATIVGCGIAGLGGLAYIMDTLFGNWEYDTDAMGWLAIALVIFAVWKPYLSIFCSIVFGGLYIASSFIPGIGFAGKEIFKMLPYAVTIIVLIFVSARKKRENLPPASLGQSYFREER